MKLNALFVTIAAFVIVTSVFVACNSGTKTPETTTETTVEVQPADTMHVDTMKVDTAGH